MANLLFICSKNQWRSPTAELLFKHHTHHNARSAGTSDKARIRINHKMIAWADVIFVMETKHKQIIANTSPSAADKKNIVVLHIEDNYRFEDEELVAILKLSLKDYL